MKEPAKSAQKWTKSTHVLAKVPANSTTPGQSAHFAEAWARRGENLRSRGLYAQAVAAFDRALKVNPDYDWAWAHRGEALRQAGHYEQAIVSFQRAVEIDTEYEWAWSNIGEALRQLGRYQQSLDHFDRAIALNPSHAWTIASKGQALRQNRQIDAALVGCSPNCARNGLLW